MRARHSLASRRDDGYPVTGPWSFRELCEHEHGWTDVGEHWLQCRICWWCKPKLGKPPKLEALPAILKGRVIPPLTGKVDVRSAYCNAGFVLDDDRDSVLAIVRVRVVQHTYVTEPAEIRRCGVEVKFKEFGWRCAAVFSETAFHRLLSALAEAEPRKPRALWMAIQDAYEIKPHWPHPWETR